MNVPAQVQVLFVAPKNGWARFDDCLAEHVVQVHYLVPAFVADDDEKTTLAESNAVLHQRADTAVDLLPHVVRLGFEATPSGCKFLELYPVK